MKTRMLLFAALLSLIPCAAQAADLVSPGAPKVFVDGVSKSFDAYSIDGSNYFKLRDVAFALNGSRAQFAVDWDPATGLIALKSGAPYAPVGGEMSLSDGAEREFALSGLDLQLNGTALTLDACNIDGFNYLKLRDLGKALNFNVTWDAGEDAVLIDTNAKYTDENALAEYVKPFGSYSVPAVWAESSALSRGDKYFYLREDSGKSAGSISIETGRSRYPKDDVAGFRDNIHRQLLWQVTNDPNASFLFGDGAVTDKGHTLCIFTIEYEGQNLTTRQYYILGDYKYALVYETDNHGAGAPGVTEAARAMVNSFEWAK